MPRTVRGGKYDLSRIDRSTLETGSFVGCLLQSMHLMYDWGYHHFFVCKVPFQVNYNKKTIRGADGTRIDDASWISSDPDDLHQLLQHVFEGEWGPTGADTIAMFMRSGVLIDICNVDKYGPEDPKGFLDTVKRNLS